MTELHFVAPDGSEVQVIDFSEGCVWGLVERRRPDGTYFLGEVCYLPEEVEVYDEA